MAFKYPPKHFLNSALGLAAILLAIEFALIGNSYEGPPNLSTSHVLRSVVIAIASAILIGLLHIQAVHKKNHSQLPFSQEPPWNPFYQGVAIIALLSNIVVLGLLISNPETFSSLAQEDVFVEPLSALFLFLGACIIGWQAWRVRQSKLPRKKLLLGGLCCLGLLLFIIAMEEISWFQRIISFETPESFSGNAQDEFNLHNFATGKSEYAYYTGAFIYLIALPFLHLVDAIPKRLGGLEVFIGGSFTLFLSSLLIAYNYDMWNGFLTQLAYFLTLAMLLSLSILSDPGRSRQLQALFIGAFIITQVVFILAGHQMPRQWGATEYKECFIAASFFIYALNVRQNLLHYQRRSRFMPSQF